MKTIKGMVGNGNRKEPVLDMRQLAKDLGEEVESVNSRPEDYAPRAYRDHFVQDAAIQHVTSFGGLPTSEIDEVLKAAKSEVARLEEECQAVRDIYVKHTTRIIEDIKRLQEGVKLSMQTMENLRAQCLQLDQPPSIQPAGEPHESPQS